MCEDVELSERRRHTKWSQDPRNVVWSSDKSKFGFRMLEKMGWAEGKGLGVNEDGMKQHVKVSVKNEKLGLGAKRSQTDDWIEQQSSFELLLADLNAVKEPTNNNKAVSDLACAATKSRKLVYQKFLKSKNLSSKGEEDMNCVLGKRKKPIENKSDQTQTKEQGYQDFSGITVVKSDVNLDEYFSKKKLQNKAYQSSETTDDVSITKKRKKKRKQK